MRGNADNERGIALRELPTGLGIVAGCVLMWLWGQAFVSEGYPSGNGWFDGLITGWEMLHGGFTQADDWRRHLHPLVLAWWGERIGYSTAGIYLSSIAAYMLVVGAALGGRALAGPWAGALAALSLPTVRIIAEAVRWVTFSPPLAGATALAVGCGCCLARWPRLGWAAATGLATALAWALDTRGVAVLPIVLVLLAIGMTRPQPTWRRIVLPLVLAAGLLPAPISHHRIDGKIVPLEQQFERQRDVARRWIDLSRNGDMLHACRKFDPPASIPLLGECSRSILTYNLNKEFRRAAPFPLWITLCCLLLALLPGRSGWRGSLAAAVALGGAATLLAYQGLRIPTPPRYVLHLAGPLAMVVPVGLIRLARTALPRKVGPWAAAAIAAAGAVYLVFVGNPAQIYRSTTQLNAEGQVLRDSVDAVRARLGPADRLMDCTELRVSTALLPRVVLPPPPMLRHLDEERCQAWMESPEPGEGESWLLTDGRTDPVSAGMDGWELVVRSSSGVHVSQLWRWTGAAHSNSTKTGTDVSSR
ncbi:MAG: hypothetical protein CMJ87_13475 [Planctomycetes bacterium]|nr:hypothetical protein [Planctomycetota bacterium]